MPIEDYLGEAQRAFESGNLDLAEKLCAQALAQSPADLGATLLSGLVEARRGSNREAIGIFRKVLAQSPEDYIATTWLQVALRKENDFGEALRVGKLALGLWPNDGSILAELGKASLGANQIEEAANYLKEACAIGPGSIDLLKDLGMAYEMLGSDFEAEGEYKKIIKLAPNRELGYVRLSRVYSGRGGYTQAIDICRAGLQRIPYGPLLHLACAQALRSVRDVELAQKHLDRAISLDPKLSLTAAIWLQDDGEFTQAAKLFQHSLDQKPVQGVAYGGIVKGRKITDADDVLIAKMSKLLADEAVPRNERLALLFAMAKAHADLQEFDTAMSYYDQWNALNSQMYLAGRSYNAEIEAETRDLLLKMFSLEFMDRNRGLGSETSVPIFIIGMIRSGTTLLEQIVSSHPDVGAAGEQRFWTHEANRIVNLDEQSLDGARLIAAAQRYVQVLRGFEPEAQRITDKMPLNFTWAGLIHLAFPKSPILHIRRNPVDNVVSIYTTDLGRPPLFASSKASITDFYKGYLTIMEHWRRIIPTDRLFELRYEDLVSDQEQWSRQVIEFCGLPWDPACLNFHASSSIVSTPSKWQVRQPIYKTSVEKWRVYEPWLGEFSELISLDY